MSNKAPRPSKQKPRTGDGDPRAEREPLSRAELKRLVSLKRKKGRRLERQFLAEGVRTLEESVKCGALPIRAFSLPAELTDRGGELLSVLSARSVPIVELKSADFRKIVDTEAPQGLAGLYELPDTSFDADEASTARRILIVENISDPGNLGSLIRSALGFGFDLALRLGNGVESYNPKVVRATAGAIFSVRTMECDLSDVKRLKSRSRLRLYVTDLQGKCESDWEIAAPGGPVSATDNPIALAVGAESVGVSSELLSLADQRIRVSHSRRLESLNVALAAGIVMHRIHLLDKSRG